MKNSQEPQKQESFPVLIMSIINGLVLTIMSFSAFYPSIPASNVDKIQEHPQQKVENNRKIILDLPKNTNDQATCQGTTLSVAVGCQTTIMSSQ